MFFPISSQCFLVPSNLTFSPVPDVELVLAFFESAKIEVDMHIHKGCRCPFTMNCLYIGIANCVCFGIPIIYRFQNFQRTQVKTGRKLLKVGPTYSHIDKIQIFSKILIGLKTQILDSFWRKQFILVMINFIL